MADHIHELAQSETLTHHPWRRDDREEKLWYIEADDKDAALTKLLDTAVPCYNVEGRNMIARDFTIEPEDGESKWTGRVVYVQSRLFPTRQWEVQTSTAIRTDALSTLRYGDHAPNFGNAIQVSGEENTVKGAEILDPVLRYTEIHPTPADIASLPLSQNDPGNAELFLLLSHVNKVNQNNWRGWKEREVRFMGWTIVEREDDRWYVDITYEFLIAPTVMIRLPGEMFDDGQPQMVEKKGWDYLWYYYQPEPQANTLTQKPVGAYIQEYLEQIPFQSFFPDAPCDWRVPDTPEHCRNPDVPEVEPLCP